MRARTHIASSAPSRYPRKLLTPGCAVLDAALRRQRAVVRRATLACMATLKLDHAAKDEAYNRNMARQMGWAHLAHLDPYEYHWDRGLYYHEIVPNLLCGTQPRHAADVDSLVAAEGITHILNLQQDKDLHYWGVKLEDVRKACARHSITHLRKPARDFDPHSLRKTIPGAVHTLTQALNGGGRVYVHCTAGLGRAPAVCIAYLYWFCDMQLDEAYSYLTAIRPCGPKRDAIRGATYDVLAGSAAAAAGNGGNGNGNGNGAGQHHGQQHHGQNHGSHGGHGGGGGDFAAFDSLPPAAFATLSEQDRFALQYRILKGLC